jgi:hypothetical protein
VRRDQVVVHVAGVGGGVADAGEPLDPRHLPDQPPEAPARPPGPSP